MRKNIFINLLIIFILLSGCSKNNNPPVDEEGKIIVLMYHRITDGETSNLYERSAKNFENDIKYLIKNNITVISFSDLENIKNSGKMPSGHSAILTFDDGDHSWYDIVLPLLKRYGMKATFFLWVEKIGSNSFLTWTEVQYMSNITFPGGIKPFAFESHSYSHQYLFERKGSFATPEEYNSFLDWELTKSKELIEKFTPHDVTVFALPYGDGAGDPDIIASARRNGFKFIRTSRNDVIGSISEFDPYNIPSLPVLDNTVQDEIGYYLNR